MADETTLTESGPEEVSPREHTRSGQYYRPDVDILERDDELIVLADMPGTGPEHIDIDFEDGTLTIHGRVPPRNQGANYILCEYGVGDYYRSFRVSEQIDVEGISAEYADGVLVLHLPKTEAAKPRRIQVQVK